MRNFDTLRGGTRARLDKMRRYRDEWNRKADSGERRYAMRSRLSDGLAGALQARSHGIGKWGSDAHGIADALQRSREEKRDYISAPWQLVDGWRNVGDSADIVSLRHTGWYSDADGHDSYRGHVWQLPARDGTPRYVAGYVEDQGGDERAGGYVVLETDGRGALYLYDEKEDAARAGDGLAERMAEDAREYSERWQEASRADSERDDARGELQAARLSARSALRALRELRANVKDCDAIEETRVIVSAQYRKARNAMHAAIRDIHKAAERIAELDMTGEF